MRSLASVVLLFGVACGGSAAKMGGATGGAPAGSGAAGGNAGGSNAGGSSVGGSNAGGSSVGGSNAGGSDAGGMTGGSPAGTGGLAGVIGTAGGSGSGGTSGKAGAGGSVARGGCSDAVLRTAPPPGKEAFRTDPIDTKFPFSQHWVGVFSDDTTYEANSYVSMTSLSDLDHDGDLDFADGQRHDVGGGMVWWEYCAPDHWVRHKVGTGHTSAAGGNATDVDGDGWVDLLAGDSWYRNPGNPRTASPWTRHSIGAPGAEEVIVGDVTGDSKPEVLYVWRSIQPQYWTPGTDPTKPWSSVVLTTDTSKRQQQGGAIGDIDGDGDNDIVVGYQWWYRNASGDGTRWEAVPLLASGFDNEPLTYLGDFDGDGDVDVAMCTHFGSTEGAARVAWAENRDGHGGQWTLHAIANGKSWTHTIVAADFDNDGDLDIYLGQNIGPQWIYENDGHGAFAEHKIAADSRGHEARVADVDCDGDLDIVGKPWGQQSEGGETLRPPRDHIYLRNLTVDGGGKARFDGQRGPYELFPAARLRTCAPAP